MPSSIAGEFFEEKRKIKMKEIRQYGPADKYQIRQNLFLDATRQISPDDFFMSVKAELTQLAENDELSITEIHNLPDRIRDTCGMIILGQEWEYGSSPRKMVVNPDSIPEIIKNYKIRIKSVNGDTIKWKKGKELARNKMFKSGQVAIFEDVWVDSEMAEGDFSCADAWKILHQAGKYCRRASRQELRERYWKYEEIPKKKIVESMKKRITA